MSSVSFNLVSILPQEIASEIFFDLSRGDKARAHLVCKGWDSFLNSKFMMEQNTSIITWKEFQLFEKVVLTAGTSTNSAASKLRLIEIHKYPPLAQNEVGRITNALGSRLVSVELEETHSGIGGLITQFGSQLQTLRLSRGWGVFSVEVRKAIFEHCQNLTSLSLNEVDNSVDVWSTSNDLFESTLTKLRSLSINQSPIYEEELLYILEDNSELRSLDLMDCRFITGEALTLSQHCTNLESLSIGDGSYHKIDPEDLVAFLASASQLQSLALHLLSSEVADVFNHPNIPMTLPNMRSITIRQDADDLLLASLLDKFPNLTEASFRYSHITSMCLKSFVFYLNKLTSLNLSDNRKATMTDSILEILAKNCPELQSLQLGNADLVTDAGLAHLAVLVKLKLLSLSNKVLYKGLETLIAKRPSLEVVKIQIIEDKTISNYEIQKLAKVVGNRLKTLHLVGCPKLSHHSLVFLSKHCTRLRSINIADFKVTLDAIKTLVSSVRNGLEEFSWSNCTSPTGDFSDKEIIDLHNWILESCPRLKVISSPEVKTSEKADYLYLASIKAGSSKPL